MNIIRKRLIIANKDDDYDYAYAYDFYEDKKPKVDFSELDEKKKRYQITYTNCDKYGNQIGDVVEGEIIANTKTKAFLKMIDEAQAYADNENIKKGIRLRDEDKFIYEVDDDRDFANGKNVKVINKLSKKPLRIYVLKEID